MKLYEVTNALIDAQHETVNTDDLDALQIAFESKAIGCVCVIKNLTGEIAQIDAELKRLTELKQSRQNNVDRLKAYLLANMRTAEIRKIESGVHRVRVQKNSQLSVTILDPDRVSPRFKEVVEEVIKEVVIDRKAIADAVKETGEIPEGCDVVQNEHLRIL
jgi:hypothetical protein